MNKLTNFLTLALLATGTAAQAQAPTFASAVSYSTGSGSNPWGLAVADVNGDGKNGCADGQLWQ